QQPSQAKRVALYDLEVRQVAESLAEQSGEILVAFDHDDSTVRTRALGEHPGDRPGSCAQLDQGPSAIPSDVAHRRPGEPTAGGCDARNRIAARKLREELAEEERMVIHDRQMELRDELARKAPRRRRASCRAR